MKKTRTLWTLLAAATLTVGLTACSGTSDQGQTPAPTSQKTTSAPASHSPSASGPAAPTPAATTPPASAQASADTTSYCAAVDDFYDVSLGGLEDVDWNSLDSLTAYVEKLKNGANEAANTSPDTATAEAWRHYAGGISIENPAAPDAEFTATMTASVTKYCAGYSFEHLPS